MEEQTEDKPRDCCRGAFTVDRKRSQSKASTHVFETPTCFHADSTVAKAYPNSRKPPALRAGNECMPCH